MAEQKAKRKPISTELANRVEFASDRTCCVCRIPGKNYQIAHINDDRSDNSFENLAILCLEHHSEAHERGGFGRNLSPEMVRLYNTSWRQLVQGRLIPQEDVRNLREYQHEVMLEISLVYEKWITTFAAQTGNLTIILFQSEGERREKFRTECKFKYDRGTWLRLKDLGEDEVDKVAKSLDHILHLHASAIPTPMKTSITRSVRLLRDFSFRYGMHDLLDHFVRALTEGMNDLVDANDETHVIDFGPIFDVLAALNKQALEVRAATEIEA